MVVPIANLTAVVTGAVHAAMGFAVEMLPKGVTRDAALETARASVAWFLRHLWAWLVAARAMAVDNLPEAAAAAKRAAASAVESSESWLQTAAKILHALYRRLVVAIHASVRNLPDADAMAVVTDAVHAAMGFAVEMLPKGVTRDAVLETARASVAWFLRHLWAWLVAARAVAVDNLPEAAAAAKRAAASAVEFSESWLQTAAKILHALYRRLVAASHAPVQNLPDADAMAATAGGGAESTVEASSPSLPNLAWFFPGHGVEVYVLLGLALLAVVFLCGAVWALTCRTMKGPGLGGARIPRAMFKASPRRYYAAVRRARKVRRGASGAEWKLLVVAPIVAYAVYLAAKTLY